APTFQRFEHPLKPRDFLGGSFGAVDDNLAPGGLLGCQLTLQRILKERVGEDVKADAAGHQLRHLSEDPFNRDHPVKGLIRDRPGDPKDYIQGARGLQRWVYNELGEAEDRKPVQVFKKSFPGDEAEVAIRTYQMQPERAGHILKLGGQLRAEALG